MKTDVDFETMRALAATLYQEVERLEGQLAEQKAARVQLERELFRARQVLDQAHAEIERHTKGRVFA
jgi:chromosome segregation ATPase